MTDGSTSNEDEDPSSDEDQHEVFDADNDGLDDPKVGDEDSEEEVLVGKLSHLNLAKDLRNYKMKGLNRVVGLKLIADDDTGDNRQPEVLAGKQAKHRHVVHLCGNRGSNFQAVYQGIETHPNAALGSG